MVVGAGLDLFFERANVDAAMKITGEESEDFNAVLPMIRYKGCLVGDRDQVE